MGNGLCPSRATRHEEVVLRCFSLEYSTICLVAP